MPVLHVHGLRVSFPRGAGLPPLPVVREVGMRLERGDFFALVGESGCGKSVTAMSLTRLPPTDRATVAGHVRFQERELLSLAPSALRAVRGRGIAYVFQEPASALNPVLRIEEQLREALPPTVPRGARRALLRDALREVRLPEPARILRAFPHELSGGMQQRVMLAMAILAQPAVLIADEPTTALDVTTQQHILALLDELRRRHALALLLITHNLGIVARHAEQVGVMYAGEIVEQGPAVAVLSAPRHPYTQGLLAAVPRLDRHGIDELHGIPGRVPHPSAWPRGCAFAPRCPRVTDACRAAPLPLFDLPDGRAVRCLRAVSAGAGR